MLQMFFEVETFKYQNVFTAKSSKRKDQKGKKITSLCTFPLDFTNPAADGEDGDRLLVTSNDSHMRLYNTKGRFVEAKYSGHENTSYVPYFSIIYLGCEGTDGVKTRERRSQIRASFSDDGKYVISGSEDRHVYSKRTSLVLRSLAQSDWSSPSEFSLGFWNRSQLLW